MTPAIGLVQAGIKAGNSVTYPMPREWENKIADSGAVFLDYANSPKPDKQIRNAFFKTEEVIASRDMVPKHPILSLRYLTEWISFVNMLNHLLQSDKTKLWVSG